MLHTAQSVRPGRRCLGGGLKGDAPHSSVMLEVDDSEFTPDHMEFLKEWAGYLAVPIPVLLARIILATSEGDSYVEKVPDYRPVPRE